MPLYHLGLGANTTGPIGPPTRSIAWACDRLAELGPLSAGAAIRTKPMHRTRQPDYTNRVARLLTPLSPTSLLRRIATLERRAGRIREYESRFGPRSLDIDILLVDDLIISCSWLSIPHPRMHLRRFVLEPLVALTPNLIDPRNGRCWSEVLTTLME